MNLGSDVYCPFKEKIYIIIAKLQNNSQPVSIIIDNAFTPPFQCTLTCVQIFPQQPIILNLLPTF